MSAADSTSLKRVLASVFTRKGGNGLCTRLFEDLAESERARLLSVVALATGELPVIGSFERPEWWLLITTNRITWRQGVETHGIPIGDIEEAVMDFDDLRSRGLTKLEARRLRLATRRGSYVIEVEAGAPLSGVWSVLKHLCARNERTHGA